MRIQQLYIYTLATAGALVATSCATPEKAHLAVNAKPSEEIARISRTLDEDVRNQYHLLAPNHFSRAIEYRNDAAEKMSKGKDDAIVLNDLAIAEHSLQEMQRVYDVNKQTFKAVLQSRHYAVAAHASETQKTQFDAIDDDLKDIGEELEQNNYKLDAEELTQIERDYGVVEIAARKQSELGSSAAAIELAISNGAEEKAPKTLEIARARMRSAERAIEISPHNIVGYSGAVGEANRAARKLAEIVSITRKNNTTEAIALQIWMQDQKIKSSRQELADEKIAAKGRLENSQQSVKDRVLEINEQQESIDNLEYENSEYADAEGVRQKMESIKSTFSPEEAEIMKDGNKIVVRLKKMNFASSGSDLNPNSFSTLRKVEELISAMPTEQVTVEGHTDSSGSRKGNMSLSERRAESVKKYLLSQDINEDVNVDTMGFGSDRPLMSNKTKGGRAANRRVDIVIETSVVL